MKNSSGLIPSGFEPLIPFIDQWATEGTSSRAGLRKNNTQKDMLGFYRVAQPFARSALTYLDKKELSDFDESDTRLMNIMLSLVHISLAIEVQEENESEHSKFSVRIKYTRTTAGL